MRVLVCLAFLRIASSSCSGTGNGLGCGNCVGCVSCLSDGSCASSGCRSGFTAVSNGAGSGVVYRSCQGYYLCVPNSNPNVYSSSYYSTCAVVDTSGNCLCTAPSSSCYCGSSTCSSYTSCTTCGNTPGCGWCSSSSSSNTAGSCQSTTTSNAGSCANAGRVWMTSPAVCPAAVSGCGGYRDCVSCSNSGCGWCSYTSYSSNTNGYCDSVGSSSCAYYNYWSTTAATCPIRTNDFLAKYQAQLTSGTTAVAVLTSLFVGFSLLAFVYLRIVREKALSTAEANVVFMYRLSILRVLVSVAGLVASFSFLSSVLTLAAASVALATMRDLKTATDISYRRLLSCSLPIHAANLTIAAIVFSFLDLVTCASLSGTVVPTIIPGSSRAIYYYSSFYFTESYTQSMTVIGVYIVDGVTFALLSFLLNTVFIALYSQVSRDLGPGAALCFCQCCIPPQYYANATGAYAPVQSGFQAPSQPYQGSFAAPQYPHPPQQYPHQQFQGHYPIQTFQPQQYAHQQPQPGFAPQQFPPHAAQPFQVAYTPQQAAYPISLGASPQAPLHSQYAPDMPPKHTGVESTSASQGYVPPPRTLPGSSDLLQPLTREESVVCDPRVSQ